MITLVQLRLLFFDQTNNNGLLRKLKINIRAATVLYSTSMETKQDAPSIVIVDFSLVGNDAHKTRINVRCTNDISRD